MEYDEYYFGDINCDIITCCADHQQECLVALAENEVILKCE